jgi:NAD+ synthase/NAD+ synthase (glutamine-hydrolysing)
MRIALLQLNQTVGDLSGNAVRIRDGVREAQRQRADLVVTSELALLGYLPRDLLLEQDLIREGWQELKELASELSGAPSVLVGVAEPNAGAEGKPLFNTAALLVDGEVRARLRKSLLPTYDVFDEDRYFEPVEDSRVLRFGDAALGITICEDIWNDRDFWKRRRYHRDPVEQLARAGAQCVINLSASPFTVGKQRLREAMLGQMAAKHGLPLAYVNQVGGNDDLVFDGRSCAFDARGKLIARARGFAEDLLVVDTDVPVGRIEEDELEPEAEIWKALVLGTRDYVRKCGFSRVLLGLSGGIDSSVTAAVAAEAVGAENVLGVLMPSPYSSRHSIVDAERLAQKLRVSTLVLPIESIMQAFEGTLASAFVGYERDVTEENIQARIRGNLLMALSNKYGALLLTTGNKSELAVGYCTLYGDMSGGLAVISDVPKTMIYRLARWLNRRRMVIPESVLTKGPSAELRPNQTDQDSLPPYDVLDEILVRHIEQHQSAEEIVSQGFSEATVWHVLELVRTAEFKRKQAAPGIKVTDRAFGVGWRMPIARKEWKRREMFVNQTI